jgi:hypothetical protein
VKALATSEPKYRAMNAFASGLQTGARVFSNEMNCVAYACSPSRA